MGPDRSLTKDEDVNVFGSAECAVIEPRGHPNEPLQSQYRSLATAGGAYRLTGMTRLVQS